MLMTSTTVLLMEWRVTELFFFFLKSTMISSVLFTFRIWLSLHQAASCVGQIVVISEETITVLSSSNFMISLVADLLAQSCVRVDKGGLSILPRREPVQSVIILELVCPNHTDCGLSVRKSSSWLHGKVVTHSWPYLKYYIPSYLASF